MNSNNPGMTPSPFTVILRPPKDLAVMPFDEALQHRMTMMGCGLGMNSINPGMTPSPFTVILRPPKDLAVLSFDEAIANIG
jgi:hypothetical protein